MLSMKRRPSILDIKTMSCALYYQAIRYWCTGDDRTQSFGILRVKIDPILPFHDQFDFTLWNIS